MKFQPLCLTSKQSIKLAKYIFSDHSDLPDSTTEIQTQPIIHKSLALTIIKASVSQFT